MSPTTPQPAAGKTPPPAAVKYAMLALFPFLMVVLMVGIMLTGMHKPTPRDMPVAVVAATAQLAGQTAQGLEDALGDSFDLRPLTSEDEARALLHDREIAGAYVLPAAPGEDATLLTAGGAGMSQQQVVSRTFGQIAAQQGVTLDSQDLAPLHEDDSMGTVSLYLTIGFTLSGLILVVILSTAAPELMRTRKLLPVIAGWAVFMALSVWLVAGPILGAVHGHALPVLGLGAATVATVALLTALFARFLGPLAVIPVVTLTMFLGVPASGGGISVWMAPSFFHTLHGVLPLPATLESVRAVLYFGGDGVGPHLLTLGVWAAAALLLGTAAERLTGRRGSGTPAAAAPAGPPRQERQAVVPGPA
ncbi:ABC transporter permease [Streptomyces avicenniae]|uniref:ABC transporter permease n=1 Tax=Streptomyces avicenniae TaxID=500153 RepID=UPI00069B77D1|nr:ABC transporter permease [Streptomyces avicenniae]